MHMHKRVFTFFLLMAVLSACGKNTPTWQEQYDLGIRYLSEGNYEEAIIAFTTAIEIDPKQAPAYVGRGDAYVDSGETEENLAAAQADYEKAIEIDAALVKAYLGLADVYIRQEDYDQALETLQNGLESTGASDISALIQDVICMQDSFINSDEFVIWEEVPPKLQEVIVAYITDFEAGSSTAIFDHLSTGFPIENHMFQAASGNVFRTVSGIYKVELRDYSFGKPVACRVEIRPENGSAYGADYTRDESGKVQTFFITGECRGWNWNGEFKSSSNDINHSGKMVDCLDDGIITEENFFSSPSGEVTTIQRLYKYGVGQGYTDSYGHHQLESNVYYTSLFNTGGWTSLEGVKEDLWWN